MSVIGRAEGSFLWENAEKYKNKPNSIIILGTRYKEAFL